MRAGDAQQIALLNHVLEVSMRLLHPFMPFLSEEIWQKLPKQDVASSLCIATWPTAKSAKGFVSTFAPGSAASQFLQEAIDFSSDDDQVEHDFSLIQETIRSVRNLRAEAKLQPSQKLKAQLFAANDEANRVLESGRDFILQLASLSEVSIAAFDAVRPANALSSSLPEVEIWLLLEGLVDKERESARLQKELETLQKDLGIVEKKLDNPQFVSKAAPAVVEKETARRVEIQSAIEKLSTRLQEMKA
jgi:valyl-tRNA synthetase